MVPLRRTRLRLVPQNAEPGEVPRLPDAELVAAFLSGERGAAEELHDRVRPLIERTVQRLLGGRGADHDDLVQIALIELVESLDRWQPGSLDAWTRTIAARGVYKHIRRRRLERRLFASEDFLQEGESRDADPARAAQLRSTLRRVRTHLSELEEKKAWAFVLHDVMGHDLREVAEITESTVTAVQQRLARGRRELHLRLASDPELGRTILELGGER